MLEGIKKTKIVATIGPASDSTKMITDLILAGVNVFRFNMKHADIPWHVERVGLVRKIEKALQIPVGILIDLQGPEIRIKTQGGEKIEVKKGETILFVSEFRADEQRQIRIPRREVMKTLQVGDGFSIDDGMVKFKITEKMDHLGFMAVAANNFVIGNNKGLNTPGIDIPLPSLTKDDLLKLDAMRKLEVDFVALSFCRTKKDILTLKRELRERKMHVDVVAKIENKKAVENVDEIIEEADVIMVARGDLGVELPVEQISYVQKLLIAKARAARKPVITATQMLQSMVENPIPTRAEVSDVANAIYDGTDAVMLSSETTSGKYPLETVECMANIARYNENHTNVEPIAAANSTLAELTIEGALKIVTGKSDHKIDGIIVFTQTGKSAKVFSSHRPKVPIIAVTDQKTTYQSLTISFGIIPVLMSFPRGVFTEADDSIKTLIKERYAFRGKTYLVLHGSHWQKPGLTNAMFIVTL